MFYVLHKIENSINLKTLKHFHIKTIVENCYAWLIIAKGVVPSFLDN